MESFAIEHAKKEKKGRKEKLNELESINFDISIFKKVEWGCVSVHTFGVILITLM